MRTSDSLRRFHFCEILATRPDDLKRPGQICGVLFCTGDLRFIANAARIERTHAGLTSPKLGWQEGDLSAVIEEYERIVQPSRWKFDGWS